MSAKYLLVVMLIVSEPFAGSGVIASRFGAVIRYD